MERKERQVDNQNIFAAMVTNVWFYRFWLGRPELFNTFGLVVAAIIPVLHWLCKSYFAIAIGGDSSTLKC
ncbi:hypothetical protein CUMW_031690 [Citrus unshiu]|nr:hypothetical protein CUMW_031690 [Citrus unshiu]